MLEELRQWKEKQTDKLGICDYIFTTREKKQLKARCSRNGNKVCKESKNR
jgi:hypothetical protein